ncbi:mechanosensitive ion channel family protein [Limosilactobacillus gorillae]|uniref:mechanosensitive ion channel family protein n=1 Tax=Limosilactobacillus gorillae TaxID=1450649 RepID=UPI000A5A9B03|nr:mechanosensitive ion channel domain-containing protein [Limosilactobacillus gorillae]
MILSATASLTNQANQISRYFTTLNWDAIIKNLGDRVLSILLAFVIFLGILWAGRLIIDAAFHQSRRIQLLGGTHRAATFHALTLNIFRYTCYFFLLYAILSLIGVPVGTLLAGAGIFSIALGLGAQGFVADVVNGFFILLEQQIDVGDVVKIGTTKGTVSAIGLRTTQVLSSDGTLTFIQNRNITMVQNFSRHNLTANVDIQILPTTPLDKLEKVIEHLGPQLVERIDGLVEKPTITGPTTDAMGRLVFRIVITARSGSQGSVAATCLAAYLKELNQANIPLQNDWGHPGH